MALKSNKKVKFVLLAGWLVVIITGCENGNSKSPLIEEINALKQEKTQLREQIEESEKEVEQLKEQVQVLSGLPGEKKAENLYNVQKIKVTRYTNLYDKDDDGSLDYSFEGPEVLIGNSLRDTLQDMIFVGEKVAHIVKTFSFNHKTVKVDEEKLQEKEAKVKKKLKIKKKQEPKKSKKQKK